MSPEQATGESLTPGSDVFSFGLVLFEIAAGRPAFADESPLDALQATLTQDPPAPASVNPRVPAALNSLILNMLAKGPAMRPSAAEVARQLHESYRPRAAPGRRLWLVELATGRRPFGRQSLDEIRAWRTKPPKVSALRPELPVELDPLIDGMLETEPAKRICMRDSAEQLRYLQRPSRLHRLWKVGALAASIGFLLLVITAVRWLAAGRRSSPEVVLNIQPLTSQWGWQHSPAISPDGSSVAFTRSDKFEHPEQIWLKRRDSEHLTQLTSSERQDRMGALVWSPDGKQIAFKRSEEPYKRPGAIYWVSREGGDEHKILDLSNANLSSSLDWSPDGMELAYSDGLGPDQLAVYLLNLKTGQKRRLTSPPKGIWGDWDPKFSPDGTESHSNEL